MCRRCWLLIFLSLTACGPKEPARHIPATAIAVAEVHVSFDEELEKLPFDPRAERLRQASQQLSQVLGHPIEITFAIALLPQHRGDFERLLIQAIEQIAQDLNALGREQDAAFSWAQPRLLAIRCHYDASASRDRAEFHPGEQRLDIYLVPESYRLIDRGIVFSALDRAFDEDLEVRFAALSPRDVAPAERETYLRFLTGYRPFGPRRADLNAVDGYVDDPRARTLLSLLELEALLAGEKGSHDSKLLKRLRDKLLSEGDYFHSAYVHHPALALGAPAQGTFRRAEQAWSVWLNRSFASLAPAEKQKALSILYVRQFNIHVATHGRYLDKAFPEVDRFALAVGVIQEWIEHGHPVETPSDPDQGLLYEFVVCPHPVGEMGHRSRGPRCEYDFWDDAMSRPEGQKRLFSALLTLADRQLTESAVLDVPHGGGQAGLLAFLRAMEDEPRVWVWAYTTAAEVYQSSLDTSIIDDARRIWRSSQERRGHVLYLLSQADLYDRGRVPFDRFSQAFGPLANQDDFSVFVSHGASAIAQLKVVWPSLAPNYSRAKPVIAELRRFSDETPGRPFPRDGIWDLIHALCAEKRASDLDSLHGFFQGYVAQHPSELKSFDLWLTQTNAGTRCR